MAEPRVAEAAWEHLRVQASCPVCLDYLREPVLLECGHNCCRACITESCEDPERPLPCPVCGHTSPEPALRPNWQLGSMVDAARQLRGVKRKARAQSPRGLFCHEERVPACVLCAISRARRAHAVGPVEEATRACEDALRAGLVSLEQKLEDVARCRASEERKPGELRRRLRSRRLQILGEVQALRGRLEEEERSLLEELDRQEHEALERLRLHAAHLGDLQRDLSHLAAEVQGRCSREGLQSLRGVESALRRCREATAVRVAAVPVEPPRSFGCPPRQYFALRKVLKELSEDVTLNPETAHPSLVVSADRKSVRSVELGRGKLPDAPRRLPWIPCVLAAQGFSSGRHCWEVDVGDKTDWALGVCRDPRGQDGELTAFSGQDYWRLRAWDGDLYAASTLSLTPLGVPVKPTRVAVFLDYQAGTLSFYNVADRSHIHTFRDTFKETLWPLFFPGLRAGRKNAAPLTIRAPTEWD